MDAFDNGEDRTRKSKVFPQTRKGSCDELLDGTMVYKEKLAESAEKARKEGARQRMTEDEIQVAYRPLIWKYGWNAYTGNRERPPSTIRSSQLQGLIRVLPQGRKATMPHLASLPKLTDNLKKCEAIESDARSKGNWVEKTWTMIQREENQERRVFGEGEVFYAGNGEEYEEEDDAHGG